MDPSRLLAGVHKSSVWARSLQLTLTNSVLISHIWQMPLDAPLGLDRLTEIATTIRATWVRVRRDVAATQKLLLEAQDLCRARRVSFDKWCERGELGFGKRQAYNLLKGKTNGHMNPVHVSHYNSVVGNFWHATSDRRWDSPPDHEPAACGDASASEPRVEYYTPSELFTCMDVQFDTDIASPGAQRVPWIPATRHITKAENALALDWSRFGFCYGNPPWGLRQGIEDFVDRFIEHANGVMLVPDWTSTQWFQRLMRASDVMMLLSPRLRFVHDYGEHGGHNTLGSALFAYGDRGVQALRNATRAGRGTMATIDRWDAAKPLEVPQAPTHRREAMRTDFYR